MIQRVNSGVIAPSAISSDKLAAGAAVSNIGFTPLNKAGDTVTGALALRSLLVVANTGAPIRRIRHWEYSTPQNTVANNATIDLFSNNQSYLDIHFILWCQGFHSSRSFVMLHGSVGGYGLFVSKVGAQNNLQTYTMTSSSDGFGTLRFQNVSGYTATFHFSALIFGDAGVTANIGTLYE